MARKGLQQDVLAQAGHRDAEEAWLRGDLRRLPRRDFVAHTDVEELVDKLAEEAAKGPHRVRGNLVDWMTSM